MSAPDAPQPTTAKSFRQKMNDFTRRSPDHWMGYFVAVSGMLMQMMTYGIDNSFSIFSESMQNDPDLGFPSATAVSFGNSVSLGLSPVFGVFTGFLVDHVPPRYMMLASTIILFVGLWLSSSVAHSTVAVTFSYCLLASISSAFMLAPGAAATGSWFRKRLGLAEGINFCGGGIGSAFIPSILGYWVEAYGWRKTFRLMSAFCAIGLVASIFSCKRQMEENEEYGAPGSTHDDENPTNNDSEPLESREEADARSRKDGTNAVSSNSSLEVDLEKVTMTAHEELMHALHTRRLSFIEILRVCITPEFLANFFMFLIYGWAFYGLIYAVVPLVSSMGAKGTVYQNEYPISTSKASTVFTFWGVFQIVGSLLVGALASFTANAFAYCLCAAVGGIMCTALAFCRTYAAFAACLSIIGFCTAGMFAVMPALIARFLYGPNLGLFMGCVFVAGCVGGFSAPPIQAQLQTRHQGNYTFGCIFISCCMTAPGVLCYLFLWPRKKNIVSRKVREQREQLAVKVRARATAAAEV